MMMLDTLILACNHYRKKF